METNISINSRCIDNIYICHLQSNIKDNKINKLFAIDFKRNIIKLIEYCISLNRTYLTSSDINYIVDQKTLFDLQTKQEIENIFKTNNLQDGFIFNYLNDQNDSYLIQSMFEFNIEIKLAHVSVIKALSFAHWDQMQCSDRISHTFSDFLV